MPDLRTATHEKHAHLGSRSEPAVRPAHVAAQVLAAFAHSPSGVALLGVDGRFAHANAALAGMLGRTEAELRLLRWQDVIHPDDVPIGESAVRRALAETEGLDEEIRALRPDGHEVRLRVTARVVPADDGDAAWLIAHYEELAAREAVARCPPHEGRPHEPGSLLGVAEVVHDLTRLARHASAAALQAVVDGVAEAIVCIDERDIVRFFSPAAEGIWRRNAAEIVGRPVWILAGERHELEAGQLRAELRAGRSVQRETVVSRKDGSHVAIRLTAIPILGPGGRYSGAAFTALDITDRRSAQREAEHARQLLQRLIDHAPNVIWFKDREGRCRLVNRRGAILLGREPDEVVDRTDFELFPRELAERNHAEDCRVIAAGQPMTFTKDMPLPDGGTRQYLTTKFPILGADGRPDGVGLVAADVSEIRRAGADRARLAALVQAAPDGIITTDRNAVIDTWNAGAEQMFGLSAEQAIGRVYDDVVLAEREREASRRLREQVLAGETLTVRMGGRRLDGSVFPTQVSAAPMAADGGHAGIVAIVRDVSELVEAELELRERTRRLERSNADLEAFAYTASHDLQEPLRSIKMSAETLMKAAAERLTDDELALLAYVDAAAGRMSAQVYALMEVARVALGQGSEERAPVQRALDDALDALRAAIRDAGAQIEVQGPLPADPVPRAEMSLVLQNLIANAIKFGRQGVRPHVTVSGAVHDGFVEVCVADNGIGLSRADSAQIFEIFGRAHAGVPGTGMGLAVCRRILERRGGSISVSSAGRNRGSEFTLRLPGAAS